MPLWSYCSGGEDVVDKAAVNCLRVSGVVTDDLNKDDNGNACCFPLLMRLTTLKEKVVAGLVSNDNIRNTTREGNEKVEPFSCISWYLE